MTDLPALREAVAKMTEGSWFWKPGSLRDIVTKSDTQDLRVCEAAPGNTNGEDDTKGIVALRNAAPALLDEVEALRERGSPGVVHEVDAAFHALTVAQRDAAWRDLAAARAVLETAHELAGSAGMYCVGVDRTLWQAWQARGQP